MSEWTRQIKIEPGFDKRHADPNKNYGIGGCTVRFLLTGGHGIVHLVLFTDWLPLHVQKERMGKDIASGPNNPFPNVCQAVVGEQPMAADLGYHSPKPLYDRQTARDCDMLPGGKCYGDGTGIGAERVRDRMLEEGEDGVWKELGRYYYETFIDQEGREMDFGQLMHALMESLGIDDDSSKES